MKTMYPVGTTLYCMWFDYKTGKVRKMPCTVERSVLVGNMSLTRTAANHYGKQAMVIRFQKSDFSFTRTILPEEIGVTGAVKMVSGNATRTVMPTADETAYLKILEQYIRSKITEKEQEKQEFLASIEGTVKKKYDDVIAGHQSTLNAILQKTGE